LKYGNTIAYLELVEVAKKVAIKNKEQVLNILRKIKVLGKSWGYLIYGWG